MFYTKLITDKLLRLFNIIIWYDVAHWSVCVCVRAFTRTHNHGAVQCVCVKYLLIHFGSSFFPSFYTKMKKSREKIGISLYSLSEWVVCAGINLCNSLKHIHGQERWIVAFVNTIPSHYTHTHTHNLVSEARSIFSSFFFVRCCLRLIHGQILVILVSFNIYSIFLSLTFACSCVFSSSPVRPSTSLKYYITWFLDCIVHYTRTQKPPRIHVCDAYARAEWLSYHQVQCIVWASWWAMLIIVIILAYSLSLSLSFTREMRIAINLL